MLCLIKGRDEKGYPLVDVDVVPEHKGKRRQLYSKEEDFHAGKIESSLSRLVELLQQANERKTVCSTGVVNTIAYTKNTWL